MKKYGITLFLTLILLLGLVVPAVSAQIPDAAPAETQEQSPELLDATVVAKGIDVSHHQGLSTGMLLRGRSILRSFAAALAAI